MNAGVGRRASGVGLTLIAIGIAACDHGPELTSCKQSIAGMWRDPAGRRWAVMDDGLRVEAYPDWPDAELRDGLEIAPRVIDLEHQGDQLAGSLHRRFMRAADGCDPSIPIHVRACHGSTIEIEIADPPAPTGFDPCVLPTIPPPTVETWTWERSGP